MTPTRGSSPGRPRAPRRPAAGALCALLIASGCSDPASPPPAAELPKEVPPSPAQVLVVNTLSETLSRLVLESGEMTVQAAVAGDQVNRIHRQGSLFLVAASGANQVELFQAWDLERFGAIDLGPGANPWLAVPWGESAALVTNWLSGDIRRLDPAEQTASPPLTTGPGPEGITVAAGFAWITCTNWSGSENEFGPGTVDVVDLAAWRVVDSVPVGRNPQDLLVAEDGRIHVLSTGTYGSGSEPAAGQVTVLDPATRAIVDTITLGGSPGRFVEAPDGTIWVSGFFGGIRRYDGETLTLLPELADATLFSEGFAGIDVEPETGDVYVVNFDADLLLRLEASGAIGDFWIVGDGPIDVYVAPALP